MVGRGLLVAVLLAACSPERGPETSPTTTGRSAASTPATTAAQTTTTSARRVAEAAVLAAYRAFWADVVAVGKTADWRSPRLADHATGEALAEARATFRSLKARGLVARGMVKLDATVLSVSRTKATLYDCNDTNHFLAYDAKTGALRDKSTGRKNGKTVTLLPQGGIWKVANVATEVGKCER